MKGYRQWGSSEDGSDIERMRRSTVPALRHEVSRIVSLSNRAGLVLDVGSSCGFFLKMMKEAGWDVLGVDPSERFAEYASSQFGIETVLGTVETAELAEGDFDVVTMWYVLEHVMDPWAVVNRARSLLKPNGLLILRVPNYTFGKSFLWLQRMGLDLSNLGVFSVPWHLYFFDRVTLKRLLNGAGFRVVSLDHGLPYYGERWLYNAAKRVLTLGMEAIRQVSFGKLFWGPAMVVVAQKA
jgi:SAM-dependent methyltransferase